MKIIANAGYIQRREYLLYRIRSDHYPFNMQRSFSIPHFDHAYFNSFLQHVVTKHEILRTTYEMKDGRLLQIIHPVANMPLEVDYFDLRGMAGEAQQSFMEAKKTHQRALAFNFETGPLFRVMVCSLQIDLHMVTVTGHHLAFDEFSFKVFDAEGAYFYSNQVVIPPVFDYRHYTAWEEKILYTQAGQAFREIWKREMQEGLPTYDCVPFERKVAKLEKIQTKIDTVKKRMEAIGWIDQEVLAPVTRRYCGSDGGLFTIVLDADHKKVIWNCSKKYNVSLSAVFIGYFLWEMYKISGQSRFAIDIPVAPRTTKQYQNSIGWMTIQGMGFFEPALENSLPGFLEQVNNRLFEMHHYGLYPYEQVGSCLPGVVGAEIPMFFNLNYPDHLYEFKHKPAAASQGITCYQQLALFVNVFENAVTLDVAYDNDLFTQSEIQSITDQYIRRLIQSDTIPASLHKIVVNE
ncbi:condensation domain-containing protein [Chitinophaga skermanii]|uniref:Condensation domain-containing protein n=1 Tax=Chitinophaga skermanii TaxID=331697 RepID=A0A327RB46_9BACT|nr:condensation domain-containing protein [Chitinophaga skermanii]RAJ11157.1 condensation domain-containing protein [Chitinophaga skermanii]